MALGVAVDVLQGLSGPRVRGRLLVADDVEGWSTQVLWRRYGSECVGRKRVVGVAAGGKGPDGMRAGRSYSLGVEQHGVQEFAARTKGVSQGWRAESEKVCRAQGGPAGWRARRADRTGVGASRGKNGADGAEGAEGPFSGLGLSDGGGHPSQTRRCWQHCPARNCGGAQQPSRLASAQTQGRRRKGLIFAGRDLRWPQWPRHMSSIE